MKHVTVLLSALLLALPFAASAADEDESPLSWEVSAVSDYLFRGVSQTNEKPTVQANITWTLPSGFYLSGATSGVDFGAGGPHVEVDYVAGYNHEFNAALALDMSLNRYNYLGAREQNYNEFVAVATIAQAYNLTLGYSGNQWNSGTTGWYYGAGATWALPSDFSFSANIGRNVFRDPVVIGAEDYTDWNVGIARTFGAAEVALGYYGTDGQGRNNFGNLADNRLLLSIKFAH